MKSRRPVRGTPVTGRIRIRPSGRNEAYLAGGGRRTGWAAGRVVGGFSSAVVPAGYSSIELVAVHGPPTGEHRFLHVGAVAGGVSDGAGAAAGAAGVGEGAADGVPAVGVVAGVGIRVRFPPAARVLAERIIARMRRHGNGEEGVDAIQQGVAEAVRDDDVVDPRRGAVGPEDVITELLLNAAPNGEVRSGTPGKSTASGPAPGSPRSRRARRHPRTRWERRRRGPPRW